MIKPKPGKNEEHEFETRSGVDESIQVNVLDIELPIARVIVAIKRLRQIVEDTELTGYDDTAPGSKNNECTWGLCYDSPRLWPDARDHTFPYDFLNRDRMSPIYAGDHCPMLFKKPQEGTGCFYTCRFFSGTKPTREQYLADIDRKLEELKARKA